MRRPEDRGADPSRASVRRQLPSLPAPRRATRRPTRAISPFFSRRRTFHCPSTRTHFRRCIAVPDKSAVVGLVPGLTGRRGRVHGTFTTASRLVNRSIGREESDQGHRGELAYSRDGGQQLGFSRLGGMPDGSLGRRGVGDLLDAFSRASRPRFNSGKLWALSAPRSLRRVQESPDG